MKREDVLKIFAEATQEQIDSVLNAIGAELNPLKKQLQEATTERDDLKTRLTQAEAENETFRGQVADLTAKVQEGMTAEERLAEMQKDAEAKQRDFLVKTNTLEARTILLDGGIPAEQCDALVAQVVSEDTDKTKALAQSIVDTVKSQQEATEQATKDALLQGNPQLGGASGTNAPITRDQFNKLSYGEQSKLLEENPGLLASFDKAATYQTS